jgi:hypothetical protein
MKLEPPAPFRSLRLDNLDTDLCIIGGGLAGTCAAITAAREGLRVILVQDRPVLGGNASSEVRLWALGATSHMGNNNRWAREGGVIDEILTENLFRNREGNALLFDALLLDKVEAEHNIRLLLNTAVFEVSKQAENHIHALKAFNSQNSTLYAIHAPLFLDASGDGIVGFLAGAAFRIGQEARTEFGELLAPREPNAELLGHSLYFMSKDTGQPSRFVPPACAIDMDAIRQIRRYRGFDSKSQACNFWWLEYGGHLDTIHDSEQIKRELWRVVYGVWNFIKNSGEYPEAETMTLEWVGHVPGKRESRRFEGDYMLIQQDIVEQRAHPDAVSYGGWAIDHHPVKGLFAQEAACTQWHSKGVYQIPYRCLYSRNIDNLLLGGRIISASHIAFGSSRVMLTCAHNAQAAAVAAAHCLRKQLLPRDLLSTPHMHELQQALLINSQYIPGLPYAGEHDLARSARISVSSTCLLDQLADCGLVAQLSHSQALMLPVRNGAPPAVTYTLDATSATTLHAELRISSKPGNHTPDRTVATQVIAVPQGCNQAVTIQFAAHIPHPCYAFVCLMANPHLAVHLSDEQRSGILTLHQKFEKAVAKTAAQQPPPNSGIEPFEFWIPRRRPDARHPAVRLYPPLDCFGVHNINNGWARPVAQANAWLAHPDDPQPSLRLEWDSPQSISRIVLLFDGDFDHPMETVLWGHPEPIVPLCVRRCQIVADNNRVVAEVTDNHQAHVQIRLSTPITTNQIDIVGLASDNRTPPAIFEVRCFSR